MRLQLCLPCAIFLLVATQSRAMDYMGDVSTGMRMLLNGLRCQAVSIDDNLLVMKHCTGNEPHHNAFQWYTQIKCLEGGTVDCEWICDQAGAHCIGVYVDPRWCPKDQRVWYDCQPRPEAPPPEEGS
jgi:hypothetical protein